MKYAKHPRAGQPETAEAHFRLSVYPAKYPILPF